MYVVIREVALSQSPCLSLPLHERQDIPLSDRPLHISDDRSVWIIKELHSHLSHVAGASGASKNLVHFGELDLLIHGKGGGQRSRSVEGATMMKPALHCYVR